MNRAVRGSRASLLVGVLLAAGAVALVLDQPVLSIPLVVLSLSLPGYAVIRLLRMQDPTMEAVLGSAVSIATLGLVALAQIYLGSWQPRAALGALLMAGLAAVSVDLVLRERRRLERGGGLARRWLWERSGFGATAKRLRTARSGVPAGVATATEGAPVTADSISPATAVFRRRLTPRPAAAAVASPAVVPFAPRQHARRVTIVGAPAATVAPAAPASRRRKPSPPAPVTTPAAVKRRSRPSADERRAQDVRAARSAETAPTPATARKGPAKRPRAGAAHAPSPEVATSPAAATVEPSAAATPQRRAGRRERIEASPLAADAARSEAGRALGGTKRVPAGKEPGGPPALSTTTRRRSQAKHQKASPAGAVEDGGKRARAPGASSRRGAAVGATEATIPPEAASRRRKLPPQWPEEEPPKAEPERALDEATARTTAPRPRSRAASPAPAPEIATPTPTGPAKPTRTRRQRPERAADPVVEKPSRRRPPRSQW